MEVDIRKIESGQLAEWYVHASPSACEPARRQAADAFAAIAEVLRRRNARILEERVFGVDGAMADMLTERAKAYGDLDDGVLPATLAVPKGMRGELAGVLVHAVSGTAAPSIVQVNGAPCGRAMEVPAGRYVTLTGLRRPDAGSETQQARAMLEKAEAALVSVGGSFHSVVRTWMWLGRILDWYTPFNGVRTRFFRERGLLNDGSGKRELPASTGIGIGPAGAGTCAMDLVAVVKSGWHAELLLAGGDQNPAFDYGSAFSRASRSPTPAGETVFVSGTAAIDAAGKTEYVGDIARQVAATIRHVRAVLRDTHCTDDQVVDAIIYCKTPEVEAHFRETWARKLPWPQVIVVADVCRDDLLFEIEATASPGAKKESYKLESQGT